MNITVYSIFSSIIWFTVFVVLFYLLRKRLGRFWGYHHTPLLILVIFCVCRLVAPVETPHTIVLQSYHIFPFVQQISQVPVLPVDSLPLTLGTLVICVCSLVAFFLVVRLLRLLDKERTALDQLPQRSDPRVTRIFQIIQEESPTRRTCDLVISDVHTEPFIFSFRRTIIVIPTCILNISDQDLYFVLKHEWQHHLDRDNQIKIAIEMLCCVLWWNPAIYLLRHNLSQTLELKCDRKVIKDLTARDKVNYMDSIVKIMRLSLENATMAKDVKPPTSFGYIGLLHSNQNSIDQDILQRFEGVTSTGSSNKVIGGMLIAGITILFFLSFAFVIQPVSLPPVNDLNSINEESDVVKIVSITPENSYLTDNMDGSFSLYVDGIFFRTVDAEELAHEPYTLLSVY